jgi:hypothetical protein
MPALGPFCAPREDWHLPVQKKNCEGSHLLDQALHQGKSWGTVRDRNGKN